MHNKHNNNNYVFEQLPDMKDHVENFKKIKGPEMWKQLRQIYYDKKINNKEEKKSFQILNESVNEVLQKY